MASVDIGFDVEGAKELRWVLSHLPEGISKNRILGGALKAAMKPAIAAARSRLKRQTKTRSDGGQLIKSLASEVLKDRKRGFRTVTMGPRKTFKAGGELGQKMKEPYSFCSYYGMVEEFGWSSTGVAPSKSSVRKGFKKRSGGQASRPADPYMRPSIDERMPYVLTDMQRYIGDKIEKHAAKLAKRRG